MRKRSFLNDKVSSPQPSTIEYEPIPIGAKLYTLQSASKQLNELYDGGYGYSSLYRRIRNGTWQPGVHFLLTDRRPKLYLPNIHIWQRNQC